MTQKPKRTPAEVFNALNTINPDVVQIERHGDCVILYDKLQGEPGRVGVVSEPLDTIEIDWGDTTEYPPATDMWEPAQWPRDWSKECRYPGYSPGHWLYGVILGKHPKDDGWFIIKEADEGITVELSPSRVQVRKLPAQDDGWQPMDTAPRENGATIWAKMGGERYKARLMGSSWVSLSCPERESRTFLWDHANQPTAWKPYEEDDEDYE